ncbi:MAG: DJ-1/PfpI family protein [Prolixibacteraceae bacterium]|nr:DJ-1/PfpI family protein [Prolixibacteraceae bacterium]
MKTKVTVHLAEGFEEIEAVSIIDVLRRASFETLVVSVTGKLAVKGAHGLVINADTLFEDVDYKTTDMIILPGGMPGASNLKNHAGLRDKILEFREEGKPLGAICAAPMVFGDLGILKNRNATCYPGFENQLTDARVTGSEVELAGNIITGKGPGAAIKFALGIVKMLKGKELAEELAQDLIVSL